MGGLMTSEKDPPRISNSYKAFPRQKEFHESKAKYRLFGGAAGPGKTKALLWEAIGQANEVAGCDTLLLRRTYPELESSLLSYFRRDVPRSMYESYSESKHVVTWLNGSTTRFGYCRNENDVYQYQGAEFLFIGIDELTHFTQKQWQFLTSRNRCPAEVYSNGKNARLSRRRLEHFCRAILQHLRYWAPHGAPGRHSARSLVAAMDFH